MKTWKEALEGTTNGTITVEDAARFAHDNKIDIEYCDPNEETCDAYYQILAIYNGLKAQQLQKPSNVHVINGCETPGYAANENVHDGNGYGL